MAQGLWGLSCITRGRQASSPGDAGKAIEQSIAVTVKQCKLIKYLVQFIGHVLALFPAPNFKELLRIPATFPNI